MTRSVDAVESVLAARLGLDAESLSPGAVERAVARRTQALDLDGPCRYLARLLEDGTEWPALVDEVVVPETWLFRDGGPFEELAAHVRSGRAPSADEPYRVLSMPCASGEEAWSAAAVLAEAGLSPREALVDAVDVSRRLVETARRGVYGAPSFRSPEAEVRLGARRLEDGRREVDASLRPYVRFHVENALEFEAGLPLPCYDAVFCRNLLIYLTPEARRRLTLRADRMLRPGGLMVLGHAEAFTTFFPGYVPSRRPRAFAAQKPADGVERGRVPAVVPRESRGGSTPRASTRSVGPRTPAAPGTVPLSSSPEAGAALLVEARRLANAGERASVERLCVRALAADPASVDARLLLAETTLAAGDAPRAEAELERVLYLAPRNETALLLLARLRDRAGDREAAARLRGRARRAARAAS